MAKRIADKELTDRNWDQEEEGEEVSAGWGEGEGLSSSNAGALRQAGTFCLASEDVLKSRPIKKAKRRNVGAEAEGGGAFKGFKGFAFSASAASAASTPPTGPSFGTSEGFKGFGSLTNGGAPAFGGFSPVPASSAAAGVNGGSASFSKPPADSSTNQANGSAPSSAPAALSCSRSREYSRQLAALNRSVRDWISKHVDDNPLCDLNPIFRDYERHLASIERKFGGGRDNPEEKAAPAEPAPPPSSGSAAAPPSGALFSFSRNSSESNSDPAPAAVTFNFGQKVDSSVLNPLGSKPLGTTFSFTPSPSQTPLFGAASSLAPLPLGGTKTEEAPPTDENGDAESEEPPKPEVKEVKEDDAFYSKKCKLFYKKDSEFKEKGVGTLHLKRTADGKTQMIIRADTNLGNILLNIMVHASMPCSRVGKNNVMVVSVPNPPVDDKNPSGPVPLLIRVKTAEDADELQQTLEERKA
uniref:Nuclear pore complex protein Nup50 n=1 Tax=Oryzias melastigma TaxID=30732 RepID=A0A3B3DX30_ORYME